jgi:hypothetical protein
VHCGTDYTFQFLLYESREGSGIVCAHAHKCGRGTELHDTEIDVAVERPHCLSLNMFNFSHWYQCTICEYLTWEYLLHPLINDPEYGMFLICEK